ncbi:MAG TPA: rRNA adenine N-6-methyltransferase family protein [Candidatus Dormibacteraeota bacterium]|nr:rRNA adenine N-6-methyltransferase family protein [Candidatus Dormibacteraeota bacterium]
MPTGRRRCAGQPCVEVREGDALELPLPRDPYKVVSNLPFHLTTALLRRLLDPGGSLFRAELIVGWGLGLNRAGVASPSLASLTWQPWFEVFIARRLPAGLFVPAPSSDAAVLSVRRRARPLLAAHERRGYLSLVADAYRSGGRLDRLLASRGARHAAARLRSRVGIASDTPVHELDVWQWIEVVRVLRPSGGGYSRPKREM